jgi:hypothetical protein
MRKSWIGRALLVLAFAALFPLSSAANAAVYLFTLTGPNTASFSLNSSPIPNSTGVGSFTLLNVAGTFNGSATTFGSISFFDVPHDGGFGAGASLDLGGPQLFTGTLTNPTFTLGTFSLTDGGFVPNYTLTITNAAVPEPATWAMMLLGFGAIGLSMRGRLRAQPA